MKCPYCNAELKKGEIVSSHGMTWYPEETADSAAGRILLTKVGVKGFWKAVQEGFSVEAHYCEACKKIILPLE